MRNATNTVHRRFMACNFESYGNFLINQFTAETAEQFTRATFEKQNERKTLAFSSTIDTLFLCYIFFFFHEFHIEKSKMDWKKKSLKHHRHMDKCAIMKHSTGKKMVAIISLMKPIGILTKAIKERERKKSSQQWPEKNEVDEKKTHEERV